MGYFFQYCIRNCSGRRSELSCDRTQATIDERYCYFGMMHYSGCFYSIDCNHWSVNSPSDVVGNGYWHYSNCDFCSDVGS